MYGNSLLGIFRHRPQDIDGRRKGFLDSACCMEDGYMVQSTAWYNPLYARKTKCISPRTVYTLDDIAEYIGSAHIEPFAVSKISLLACYKLELTLLPRKLKNMGRNHCRYDKISDNCDCRFQIADHRFSYMKNA